MPAKKRTTRKATKRKAARKPAKRRTAARKTTKKRTAARKPAKRKATKRKATKKRVAARKPAKKRATKRKATRKKTAKRKRVEVLPEKGGPGWVVARQGAKSVLSTHKTQSVAVKRARGLAKRLKTELVVKGRGGKIRSKESFGADSRPRRG
jgi:hypothetical protein